MSDCHWMAQPVYKLQKRPMCYLQVWLLMIKTWQQIKEKIEKEYLYERGEVK